MKNLLIICGVFLIQFFTIPIFARQKRFSLQDLAAEATKMFTWDVKEAPPHGYMMFLDVPYAVKRNSHNYISVTVAKKYNNERPAFISFTLPDNILRKKGLSVIFSSNSEIQTDSKWYQLFFGEHWGNNHTITARLQNGFWFNKKRTDSVDIFEKLMQNKQMFIAFYDSSGLERLAVPLIFFQKQYKKLLDRPTYSTGNPADTALTENERINKNVYGVPNMRKSWKIAGIMDPIRLKHFIKYFRYLVNHNREKEIAELLVYPLDQVIPQCADSVEFVHNFNKIFDAELRKAINNQKLNQIFHNAHGVMIGNGPNIWIRQRRGQYEIYGITNLAYLDTR